MTSASLARIGLETHTDRPALADEWRNVLSHARMVALECRSAARSDLFQACALLSHENHVARDAHLVALIKGLRTTLAQPPVFYRPGVASVSFDEDWLIAGLMACERGDWNSLSFLVRSRIPKMHCRHIVFLLFGIQDQFLQT